MKKQLIIGVLTLLIWSLGQKSPVLSQALSNTYIKAGYFNPKGKDNSGFIFGGSYTWVVDEAVDIGIAVDYFRKSYDLETDIARDTTAQGNFEEREIEKKATYSANILPIYGVINIKFPAGTYLDYYVSGGLGYEWLFRKEVVYDYNDQDEDKEIKRTYGGFKWIISGGIMYRVGTRSSFLVEVFYDGTKVSRDKKREQGAPTRYEVDLSGLGIRAGIRMGFH